MRAYVLGAIAPGKIADLLLVDNLENFKVKKVIASGQIVAEDGKLTVGLKERKFDVRAYKSVKLDKLNIEDMMPDMPVKQGEVEVNAIDFAGYTKAEESNFLDIALTKLNRMKIR